MRLLALGLKSWRRVAGRHSPVERYLRGKYAKTRLNHREVIEGDGFTQIIGDSFVVVRATDGSEPRRGIVLRGGCDLPSMFVTARHIRTDIKGSVAIFRQGSPGELGSHRTDQILQTLRSVPEEHTEEAQRMLRLGPDFFNPRLFNEREFTIPALRTFPNFPKTVLVLSIGSDLVRTVYRHKEHGYLVDPGGFWLNQLEERAMPDPEIAKWFKTNFRSVGKISVEDFRANLERIVNQLRANANPHLIVFNTLVVDPLNPTHDYRFVRDPHVIRRREFNIALKELSAQYNFHVLDIDRILKRQGIREQIDFAHFPLEKMEPIGVEAYRILKELEVV